MTDETDNTVITLRKIIIFLIGATIIVLITIKLMNGGFSGTPLA